jgi:hypothetical protein
MGSEGRLCWPYATSIRQRLNITIKSGGRSLKNADPPRVGVARFGDCSLATFVAAGRFTGNQPKISHKLAEMIEALESPEFGNRDHCRQELEAFESHERIDSGPKSPTRKPVEQGRLATLDSLLGGFLGRRTNHYRMDLPGPL